MALSVTGMEDAPNRFGTGALAGLDSVDLGHELVWLGGVRSSAGVLGSDGGVHFLGLMTDQNERQTSTKADTRFNFGYYISKKYCLQERGDEPK